MKNITEKRKKELIGFCKLHPNVINVVFCVGPWDLEIEFDVKDNLTVIGDMNIPGMEDSFITGIYAANRIIAKENL